jgi:hypothetical protein
LVPDRLPRFALLPSEPLARQAEAYGLPPIALERLVVIDRLLRSMAAGAERGGDLFGYVLAGPTALLGVYLHTGVPLRIPDELTLAPSGNPDRAEPGLLANLLAACLPEGRVETDPADSECWQVSYDGMRGPGILTVRFERAPLSIPAPPSIRDAHFIGAGWLYDQRLHFRSRVAAPFAVPVAFAEEVVLRELRALALWSRPTKPARIDDRVARVDDLRLLTTYEYEDFRTALIGPVRDRLAALVSDRFEEWIKAFAAVLDDQVKRHASPSALPAGLRPAIPAYGETERAAFIANFERLLHEFVAPGS